MKRLAIGFTFVLASGCASEIGEVVEVPTSAGGKADRLEEETQLVSIRNDLEYPVTVVFGAGFDAWVYGTSSEGVDVDAYASTAPFVVDDGLSDIVVVDAYDTPLDPDSLRGSYWTAEDGSVGIELVVGLPESPDLGAVYLREAEGEDPTASAEETPEYVAAYDVFAERWSGTGTGYSRTRCSAWGWTTDSDLRNKMKAEGRDNALRNLADIRFWSCRNAGGTLATTKEDCSYLPTGVPYDTTCTATCEFDYYCARPT